MFFEKTSLGLVVLGLFFSTIASGETYRCVKATLIKSTNSIARAL